METIIAPMMYLIFFIGCILSGYAIFYQYIFGPYLIEFLSFNRSINSFNSLYLFGDYIIKSKVDKVHSTTGLLISLIVTVTFFFGMISLFHSMVHESYRLVESNKEIYEQSDEVKREFAKNYFKLYNWITCKKVKKA